MVVIICPLGRGGAQVDVLDKADGKREFDIYK